MDENPCPTPGITTASDDCQRTSTADSTSTEDPQPTPNGKDNLKDDHPSGSHAPASREDIEKKALKMKKYLTIKLNSEACHTTADVFSVALGEDPKPIGILTDEHLEEMCNSTKVANLA